MKNNTVSNLTTRFDLKAQARLLSLGAGLYTKPDPKDYYAGPVCQGRKRKEQLTLL